MNDKEISEIRRHTRRDRSNITALYGCYVNDNKEIITEFRQSTALQIFWRTRKTKCHNFAWI